MDAYLASLLCFSGLLHEQNMAKMRLLTFMGMAVENKEISFDTMQQELQIGADDVEAFVTDVVRTKMVFYKSDQTQRKVVVSIAHIGHLENNNANNSMTQCLETRLEQNEKQPFESF